MSDNCYIGRVWGYFDAALTDMGHLSLAALGEPLAGLLVAWTAVVFAWKIIRGIMQGLGESVFGDAMVGLFFPIFTITLLYTAGAAQWYWPLFDGLKDFGPWAATVFLGEISGTDYTGTGISGLMCAVEKSLLAEFIQFAEILFNDISIWNKLIYVIGSLVLTFPFIWLIWELQKGVLFAYMKIQAIGILSPFIILCLGDRNVRPIVTHAVKIMVTSGLELLLSAASVAMIIHLSNQLTTLFRADPETGSYIIFSADYWSLLFTAIILLFVHKALISVAQQLMQTAGDTASDAVQPARGIAQAAGFVGAAASAATTGVAMTKAITKGIKLGAKYLKS